MANPLVELQKFGQSVWYDNIRRGFITSGELQKMVDDDGLLGITSNPAIFEKAITGSTDYDAVTEAFVRQGKSAQAIYEALAIEDIQLAADVMLPIYEQTDGRDGYVSLEVSPHLAHHTENTIAEARRLHDAVTRDNVMIKVPATPAGIPAIEHLIGAGMNINVTLIFSLEVYEAVVNAYISGLEKLATAGGDVSKVSSVASFFLSHIDTLVDSLAEARLATATCPRKRTELQNLIGRIAIDNAKLAYHCYKGFYNSNRWQALADKGACTQRLLWASTSTKNPNYRDVRYVEELIGPETVSTMPAAALTAFRDHGKCRASLEEGIDEAREAMEMLGYISISIEEVTHQLLDDGVKLFADAFDKLISAVEKKREVLLGTTLDRQVYTIASYEEIVNKTLEDWRQSGKVHRLWDGDASLWTNTDESH